MRKHHALARERYRSARALLKGTPAAIDAALRALSDNPPEISSSEERIAYFRGFLAGHGRTALEGSRFELYKDLVVRIASEFDRKYARMPMRLSFEDTISVGYEAVLNLLRSKRELTRQRVAAAIRCRIIDEARSRFGKLGTARMEGAAKVYGVSGLEALSGEDEPYDLIQEAEAPAPKPSEAEDEEEICTHLRAVGIQGRDAVMLSLFAQGMTARAIGERIGLTESGVCLARSRLQAKYGEKLRVRLAS